MPDQARLILGQISLCTKQHSSQMPGRGAWAVLKLTVTLSTRGLAYKTAKNVTNCTHYQDTFIGRVAGQERVA